MPDERVDVLFRVGVDDKSVKATKEKIKRAQKETQAGLNKEEKSRERILQYEQRVRLALEKNVALEKKRAERLGLQEKKIREQALTYEQKVRTQLDRINQKEADRTKQLQLQLQLFKEQQQRRVSQLQTGSLASNVDSAALSSFSNSVKNLTADTPELSNRMRVLNSEFKNIKAGAARASATTFNLGNTFKEAFVKFSLWLGVSSVFFGITIAIRKGVESIRELDTAMVELRKVTDVTEETYKSFTKQAFELGAEIGRTGTEVIQASAAFARMGSTIEESLQLAEQALLLTNIGDGIETVNQATVALISTMKGFGLEAGQASKLVDSLNEVSNNFAVNTGQLTEGIKRASGVLAQSNTTFDETLGLITGGTEIIQNAEKVSTGLVTISQRLRGISDEGEVLTPKLQEAFSTLGEDGIDILDSTTGQLRSTFDLLKDLSEVYPDLTSKQRQYIGELVSGKRRAPILEAILSNFDNINKAVETSRTSFGSARKENEKYLDSIDGRLKILSSTSSEFWDGFISSELIKSSIDGFTGIISILTDLNATMTPMPLIIAGITAGFLAFRGTAIVGYINQTILATSSLTVSLGGLNLALGGTLAVLALVSAAYQEHSRLAREAEQRTKALEEGQKRLNNLMDNNKTGENNEAIQTQVDILETLQIAYFKLRGEIADLEEQAESQGQLHSPATLSKLSLLGAKLREVQDALADQGVETKDLAQTLDDLRDSIASAGQMAQDVLNENLLELNDNIDDTQSNITFLNDVMQELSNTGTLSGDTLERLNRLFPDLADSILISADAVEMYEKQFKQLSDQEMALQKTITSETIKQTELRIQARNIEIDQISRLIAINSALGNDTLGQEKQYIRLTADISDYITELKDLNAQSEALTNVSKNSRDTKEKEIVLLTEQEKALIDVSQELAVLNEELNRAKTHEENLVPPINNLIAKEKERMTALQNLTDTTKNQIDAMKMKKSLTDEEKKDLEGLVKTYNAYSLEIERSRSTLAELVKTGDEYLEQKLDEKVKEETERFKELKSSLDDLFDTLTDKLKQQRDAAVEGIDLEIQGYKDEIDEIKEKNRAIEDTIKLQKMQSELERLEQERANIQANKNVRKFTGSGFEFVSDPREVRKNAEEIAKVQEEISDFNRQQAQDERITELEAEVDKLEQEKKETKDSYDARLNLLKKYEKNVNTEIDKGGKIQNKTLEKVYNTLRATDKKYYDDTIKLFEDLTDAINDSLASIESPNLDAPSSSGGGGASSSKKQKDIEEYRGLEGKNFVGLSTDDDDRRRRELKDELGFRNGGEVTKTGPTMVHGSEARPELMLNSGHIGRLAQHMTNGTMLDRTRATFDLANTKPSGGASTTNVNKSNPITIQKIEVTSNNATQFVEDIRSISRFRQQ